MKLCQNSYNLKMIDLNPWRLENRVEEVGNDTFLERNVDALSVADRR